MARIATFEVRWDKFTTDELKRIRAVKVRWSVGMGEFQERLVEDLTMLESFTSHQINVPESSFADVEITTLGVAGKESAPLTGRLYASTEVLDAWDAGPPIPRGWRSEIVAIEVET
jgi:hypothetical protein